MDIRQKLNIAGLAFFAVFVTLGAVYDDFTLLAIGLFVPVLFFFVVLPLLHHTAFKKLPPVGTPRLYLATARWLDPAMRICVGLTIIGVLGGLVDFFVPGSFSEMSMILLYIPSILAAILWITLFIVSTEERYNRYRWWFFGALALLSVSDMVWNYVSPSFEMTTHDYVNSFFLMGLVFIGFKRPYTSHLVNAMMVVAIFVALFATVLIAGIALGW